MTEKKRTRPTYSPEFKQAALDKCRELGINRTSAELGVARITLKSWMAKQGFDSPKPGKPSYQDLEAEVRRLKKELGYVTEINKVLKKSTAIFSRGEMGDMR